MPRCTQGGIAVARLQTILTLSLLCLCLSADSHAQDLPEVDVDALMEQVNTLADQLRTEAQRLIDEEGSKKAAKRLMAEAEADGSVAYQCTNLAVVVLALTGRTGAAREELYRMPGCTDAQVPLGLGRTALFTQLGLDDLAETSGVVVATSLLHDIDGPSPARLAVLDAGLAHLAPNSNPQSLVLRDIGYWLRQEGAYRAAIAYYRRALAIIRSLRYDAWRSSSAIENSIANLYRDIGRAYRGLGDHGRAARYAQRHLCIKARSLRLDDGSIIPGGHTAWTETADALLAVGDTGGAIQHYQQALSLCEQRGTSLGLGRILLGLGEAHRRRGDPDAALPYLRRSVGKSDELYDLITPGYYRWGRMPGAPSGRPHRCLVAACIEAGRPFEAATATEGMRARDLLRTVAERSIAADTEHGLAERAGSLESQMDRTRRNIRDGVGDQRELRRTLRESRMALLDIVREVRRSDPRYASLKYPIPLTVEGLSAALDPGTVVLSFIVGGGQTSLVAFGPGIQAAAHTIEVEPDDLEGKVEMLLDLVRQGQDVASPARTLGELLLAPVADVLANADRVLILPDGPLWALPFQALPVDEDTYLCDMIPVHYAPSGTVFVESRRLREDATKGENLLAYGDPDFTAQAAGDNRGAYIPLRSAAFEAGRAADGLAFKRLPYSGLEASLLGSLFGAGADVRQSVMATEESLRADGPGRRILHVATHGLLDPVSPMDSALVLSLPRERQDDHTKDGFLKAWEVFGLDLSGCDLVTLSACETAKGEVLSGEGVIGLTRAFMYAGAASVLCTQWKVADDSTAALMVRFYTHYRDGDSKDVALQTAMREIRTGQTADGKPLKLPDELGEWKERWSQPYFWAPFILMGEYLQT